MTISTKEECCEKCRYVGRDDENRLVIKCKNHSCPCHTQDQNAMVGEEWEKEYDREFGFDPEYMKTLSETLKKEDVGLLVSDIKSFISRLLKTERKSIDMRSGYTAGRLAERKALREKVEEFIEAEDLTTPDNFLRSLRVTKIAAWRDVLSLLTNSEQHDPRKSS